MVIDKNLFEVNLVYIDKLGDFYDLNNFEELGEIFEIENDSRSLDRLKLDKFDINNFKSFDIAFPMMHGPNCEDGSMQGFLNTLGMKYVGSKVLASAMCMDKDMQKQIARFNNIKVTDWISVKKFEYENQHRKIIEEKINQIKSKIESDLKYPIFIKPCNMGSSVGVVKVKSENELEEAIESAFKYDSKIIIEKAVIGREIEVAVLGKGNDLVISNPGEVISLGAHEFYDYDAKYIDDKGSKTFIPATNISDNNIIEFRDLSRKIFNLLECEGLSRIDYFLCGDGQIILNEVNTLPGFTNISMYLKLMEDVGVDYTDLITRLLRL